MTSSLDFENGTHDQSQTSGEVPYNALLKPSLALRIGAEPRYRYTDPALLVKPCTLVNLQSRSRHTIQEGDSQYAILTGSQVFAGP